LSQPVKKSLGAVASTDRIDTSRQLGENGGGRKYALRSMTMRTAIKTLVVLALALPIVVVVLLWVASLLRAMGDATGAAIVGYVGTACQIAWAVSLVNLLVVLAVFTLQSEPPGE
jgi:hypothetical protein